jgi:predicted ATPase
VEEACERSHRGGIERLRTQGASEAIEFELYYREDPNERPISYTLHVGADRGGRAYVAEERLRQRRPGQVRGWPYSFVDVKGGRGFAWTGESTKKEAGTDKVEVQLEDRRKLAITSLGNLSQYPRIVKFREFLEGWSLSYFVPDLARGMPSAGAQRHLNSRGDNLANYVQFLEKEQPARFRRVLNDVSKKIPGVRNITHKRSEDGRLLLQFNDRGYQDPFYAQSMSDGTLKYFAYMLLLEDPHPAPLIGIEEPENGLHHQLLSPLAREMRVKAREPGGPQILVTTHANYFVDGLTPDEVFVLSKNEEGFSTIRRAADDPQVVGMVNDGISLGSLWYSNHLGGGNP